MALEAIAHALTVAAALLAVLAPVSAVGLGLAPRAGPVRALALALTSRLCAAATVSQRADDVRALQTSLRCAETDYIVVCGPKGVGKTCVVETVTQRRCGVVSVRVAAGAPSDAIARQALSAIARVQLAAAFFDVTPSARRVIFWHRLLSFGRPTVVLQLSERRLGAPYADVAGAARELVSLGLAVVIDASDGALEPGALAAERQVVLELEPMPRQTLESIAALEPLRAALQRAGLRDLVWATLGGSPAAYRRLREQWAEAAFDEVRLAPVVQAFVQRQLVASMSRRDHAIAGDARLPHLYAHFAAGAGHVPRSVLREMLLRLPSPDKVLRAVQRCGAEVLIPADAAMALVLRHDLQVAPPLHELQALLARGSEPPRGTHLASAA